MGLTRKQLLERRTRNMIALLRAVAKGPLFKGGVVVGPRLLLEAAMRLEDLTGGPPAPIGAKWKEGRGR